MPCCWEADFKAENQRIGGGTSKKPDLLGQEKQEKGHEGDNEMEKNKILFKSMCQKVTRSCHNGMFLEVEKLWS